jgi:hypothetical protein
VEKVSILDRNAEQVRDVLRDLLEQCESGDISGAVIVTEHQDHYDLAMPGTFSTEPESIACVVGRLYMAANIFCNMTDDEDAD